MTGKYNGTFFQLCKNMYISVLSKHKSCYSQKSFNAFTLLTCYNDFTFNYVYPKWVLQTLRMSVTYYGSILTNNIDHYVIPISLKRKKKYSTKWCKENKVTIMLWFLFAKLYIFFSEFLGMYSKKQTIHFWKIITY